MNLPDQLVLMVFKYAHWIHPWWTDRMDPSCHPKLRVDSSEDALLEEQNDFYLTGAVPCVKVISRRPEGTEAATKSTLKPVLLDEIIERPVNKSTILPPKPRGAESKPVIREPSTVLTGDFMSAELQEISAENDRKLEAMKSEEIMALQEEIKQSLPEKYIEFLKNRKK